MAHEMPAYPDAECEHCDAFCLDPFTATKACIAKQHPDLIAMYLGFVDVLPRPLIQADDELPLAQSS